MRKWLLSVAIMHLLLVPQGASSQYMFLDTNGSTTHDAGDLLNLSGSTLVDVYLVTNQNRTGSSATCPSGEQMSIFSYEFILRASGGGVAWSNFLNHMPLFNTSLGEASSASEYHNGRGAGTALPPGKHRLCTLTVTVTGGNPYVAIVPGSLLSDGYKTSFGSECPGVAFDNTLTLGQDWHDVDGAGDLTKWIQNGVGVCTVNFTQVSPQIAPDGAGGAILVWVDGRNGNSDIFAQRLDATGRPLWLAGGVPVCTEAGEQRAPAVLGDAAGGVFIVWEDLRGDVGDIYGQRLSATGGQSWTISGVPIGVVGSLQREPTLCTDNSGGIIAAWTDRRNGDDNIWAQRVDGNGVVQWQQNGVLLASPGVQYLPQAVSDGAGGAIVAWTDFRQFNQHGWAEIYSQRVNSAGATLWPTNGVAVSTAGGNQWIVSITSDGVGGAIMAWRDERANEGNGLFADIYAQRLDAGGSPLWTPDGVSVSATTGDQQTQDIAPDGAGGAFVTWSDSRSGGYDVYAQRLTASGTAAWATNGQPVCTVTGTQSKPRIIGDGSGGCIVVWEDARAGASGIYAQRVLQSGVMAWTANGAAVSVGPGAKRVPTLSVDGSGGAIIAWQDERNGNADIFAHRIARGGGLYITDVSVAPAVHDVRLQNRPNPFNPSTEVRFRLESDSNVLLDVFSISGRHVSRLAKVFLRAGDQRIVWEGTDSAGRALASGVYVCRLRAKGIEKSIRMVLLK